MRIASTALALSLALAACGTAAHNPTTGARYRIMQTDQQQTAEQQNQAQPQQQAADQNKGGQQQTAKETKKGQEAKQPAEAQKGPEAKQPAEAQKGPEAKPPAGGGGGAKIDTHKPEIKKAMESLNLNVINQNQVSNQLQQINEQQIDLKAASSIRGGIATGVHPEILSILQPNISNVRFMARDGLFFPFLLEGQAYAPVIVTVDNRPATVFFTLDCTTQRYVAHTILL